MDSLPIINSGIPLTLPKTSGAEVSQATKNFEDILSSTINQVNQADLNGEMAIKKLNTGEAENLHEVMIAAEEADIAIRMLVQMRNKALEAYNEIMRLQI
jgi:flagellar hook-basal body complex protein FliE